MERLVRFFVERHLLVNLVTATVIVMGRMIAYNWFDCDRQPQSAFVNRLAGCVLE